MPKARICKDCLPDLPRPRPAPHPGPRCATHHRAKKKADGKKAHEKRAADVYGLEPGDYDKIFELQGGACAVCRRGSAETRRKKRLPIDHRHSDGLFRGLLCSNCNNIMADARDEVSFFEACIEYLRNPPAAFLQRYAPGSTGAQTDDS